MTEQPNQPENKMHFVNAMHAFKYKKQEEKLLDRRQKKLAVFQKIIEIEKENHKLIDGSLKFRTMQEYYDLQSELNQLQYEENIVAMKDEIEQTKDLIEGAEHEYQILSRNGKTEKNEGELDATTKSE